MTASAHGKVRVRWLPGLGGSPGGVDLTAEGPVGTVSRAVSLPDALTAGLVIDLLCPASHWYETISRVVPVRPPTQRRCS